MTAIAGQSDHNTTQDTQAPPTVKRRRFAFAQAPRPPWTQYNGSMDTIDATPLQQTIPHASKRGGRMAIEHQCGAKTRSGRPCRAAAMANGRCRMHGGPSPIGPAHPRYTTGRSSKYLPPGPIADAYAEMHRDRAQLMDLSDDIAVIDGFRADALAALSGADLATLADTIDSISKALVRDVNPITPQEAAERLRQAAQNANDAAMAKRRATSASHDKAKLIQVELQRRAQMDKLLTKEQAIAYGTAIVDACKSKLSDEDHQWLANEAHRAAVRILLGADPDQQ